MTAAPEVDVARRTRAGAAWLTSSALAQRAVSLGVFAVLARLLDASAFGVVGFAAVLIIGTEILVKGGVAQAVIQRPQLEERHMGAALVLSTATGVAVAGLLVASAPLLAAGVEDPRTTAVVQLLAVRVVLLGMAQTSRGLLMRQLRFRVIGLVLVASTAAGGVAGVALAVAGAGVWALVTLSIVEAAVSLVLLVAATGGIRRVRTDRAAVLDMWRFSRWVVAEQAVDFLSRRGDVLAVGWVLGAGPLGVYTIGQRLVFPGVQLLVQAPLQVLMPALRHRGGEHAPREPVRRAMALAQALYVPAFVGLSVLSPEVIVLVFGDRWAAAAPVLAALALYGIVAGTIALSNNVLFALGRPRTTTALGVAELVACGVALLLVTPHGIVATAVGFTAASFLVLPLRVRAVARAVGLSARQVGRTFAAPIGAALAIAAEVQLLRAAGLGGAGTILVGGTVGALTTGGLYRLLAPDVVREWRALRTTRRPGTRAPEELTVAAPPVA